MNPASLFTPLPPDFWSDKPTWYNTSSTLWVGTYRGCVWGRTHSCLEDARTSWIAIAPYVCADQVYGWSGLPRTVNPYDVSALTTQLRVMYTGSHAWQARSIDAVPWQIHVIVDEDAYRTALHAYLVNT